MSCVVHQLSDLLLRVREDEGPRRTILLVGLIDAFAVMAFIALGYSIYRWWRDHPLYGKNKGEPVFPLVGSLLPHLRNKNRLLEHATEILQAVPGRSFRIVRPGGTTIFVTANPSNVEYILKTNFENYPKGAYWREHMRELLGDGIFNADDQIWKFQRKVASHEFTTRSLREFMLDSAERETSDRLVPFLRQASRSGEVFDLQDIFARFAFDNICHLGFGVDPACLDISLPRVRFAEAFDRATVLSMAYFQYFPKFPWKIKRVLKIGHPEELRNAVEVINDFAMGVIESRRQELAVASAKGDQEGLSAKTDLLSRFMAILETEPEQGKGDSDARVAMSSSNIAHEFEADLQRRGNKLKDVFLRDIVISFILAGRDTTTSALSWFFWLLSTHRDVELAILDEISRVVGARSGPPAAAGERPGDEKLSSSSTFSFDELKSMQYLHAALMESMRLYPPVPRDLKVSKDADMWPDGTVLPANTLVVFHPYAMGRLEDLWGKDVLQFRPERWLQEGRFVPQSPYKFTAFLGGPRICLGKDMIMMQMKLASASILANFELFVAQDYKPQYEDSLVMRLRHGLPVTVRTRVTKSI